MKVNVGNIDRVYKNYLSGVVIVTFTALGYDQSLGLACNWFNC